MGPFCCCFNCATVDHIGMQVLNFVVLSVVAHDSALIPLISKTHLHIVSLNVCGLELNRCSKYQSRKREAQFPQ